MQILSDYHDLPSVRSSITIGSFDGLHLGHRAILRKLVHCAADSHTASVLLTFSPHPLQVLHPNKVPKLIMTVEEKTERIRELGIEYLLIMTFDTALSKLTGEQFVRDILVNGLRMKHLFVGHDFVFGHRRTGNVALLKALAADLHFSVEVTPQVEIRGSRVSSTRIRELVQAGQIGMANRLLGRYYSIHGNLVPGQGIGSKQLLPTLNMQPENELLPGHGVYVTLASFEGSTFQAVTNVGTRPTVDGTHLAVETHVLEREIRTRPKNLELQFLHRLRDEERFPSLDALKAQLEKDVLRAGRFFRLLKRVRRSSAQN